MGPCGGACGITAQRARELLRARAAAERAHPGLVWAGPRLPPSRALTPDALRHLAARLESLLPVRALVHLGEPTEHDSIFLLAGLHRPCLRELVERNGSPREAIPSLETYIQIALSPHGRFAALVEVVSSSEAAGDGFVVVHAPRAGVEDRRLQHIVKGIQGALRASRVTVLDLATILTPLADSSPTPTRLDAFDEPVSLWSLLFEGPSPLAVRAAWVPAAGAA